MYIILINSATMLDSPVLHFNGKKKKKKKKKKMKRKKKKKTSCTTLCAVTSFNFSCHDDTAM